MKIIQLLYNTDVCIWIRVYRQTYTIH